MEGNCCCCCRRFLISRQQSAKFNRLCTNTPLRSSRTKSNLPTAQSERALETKRTNTNAAPAEHVCVRRSGAERQPNAEAVDKRIEISFVPGDFSSILNAWRSPHVGSVSCSTNAAAAQHQIKWRARTQQQYFVLVRLQKFKFECKISNIPNINYLFNCKPIRLYQIVYIKISQKK